jgi:hypothetical protein
MWEGVIRILTKDNFARAFVRWCERCEKCLQISNNSSPNYNAFCFICVLQFDFERTQYLSQPRE